MLSTDCSLLLRRLLSRRGQSPLESGPPGPNFAAIPGLPLLPTAAFSQFPLPQRWTCSLDTARLIKTRQDEAASAEVSAGGGDDTTPTEEESV